MSDHITHIEHDGSGFYYWCEAEDCYANDRKRYQHHSEVIAAATEHERHPG